MSAHDLYLQKRVTPAEAVEVIRNGDFIAVPTEVGEPPVVSAN